MKNNPFKAARRTFEINPSDRIVKSKKEYKRQDKEWKDEVDNYTSRRRTRRGAGDDESENNYLSDIENECEE